MPKAKNDVQDTSINDPLQKISVKMDFYFDIFKQSVNFGLFLRITRYLFSPQTGEYSARNFVF